MQNLDPVPDPDEELRADNEFLKMKLMLERGAQFGGDHAGLLPAELENKFLRNVIEFEQSSDEHGHITVFDKIGRPAQFAPAEIIADDKIEGEWEKLSDLLFKFNISVGFCSPRVTARDLYRFSTEDLFRQKVMKGTVDGMIHGFIYDEFYPDHIYDNTCIAVNDCLQEMLRSHPFTWMYHFVQQGIRLNEHFPLTQEQFREMVNEFQRGIDKVYSLSITNTVCEVNGNTSGVKGRYDWHLQLNGKEQSLGGDWLIELERDEKWRYWRVHHVSIQQVAFGSLVR